LTLPFVCVVVEALLALNAVRGSGSPAIEAVGGTGAVGVVDREVAVGQAHTGEEGRVENF
jgi:hypothetical protein